MGKLSGFGQRFLSDPYGTAIQAVIFLMFLAVGIGLIVWGVRYAIRVVQGDLREVSAKTLAVDPWQSSRSAFPHD